MGSENEPERTEPGTGWDDDLLDAPDDLVAALRAPGTAAEWRDEAAMTAAFRAAHRSRGSLVRRLGISGTAAVVVVGLSSGVAAAAYTQHLPDPIQNFAHDTFHAVGVPEPKSGVPRATAPPVDTPTAEPAATAPSAPSRPSATAPPPPATAATDTPSVPTPAPPSASAPTGSPQTPATGAPKRPPASVATVTVASSTDRVREGGTVVVSGRVLSAAGKGLGKRHVTLLAQAPGRKGWTVVAQGTSDRAGKASFLSPALANTTRFRLAAQRVRSRVVTVKVAPTLAASWAAGTLTVQAAGLRAGDAVTIRVGEHGPDRTVTLDARGRASVAVPQTRRRKTCRVTLPATRLHTQAVRVVVVPAAP